MANTSAPFGLKPYRRLDGAALSFNLVPYKIAYNNANQIGKGDLIQMLPSGFIDLYAPQSPTTNDPNTTGVFWGCEYLNPALGYNFWYNAWTAPAGLASTTVVTAWAIVDPQLLFLIQSSGTAIAQADVGANADILAGTPNTAGFSTQSLDAASLATTAQLPLRVVEVPTYIANNYDPAGTYNNVLVKLNSLNWLNTTGVTT